MPTQRIQFSEWLPDQPGITGALTDAKNCVSQAVGYGPFPQPVEFSEAASENLTSLFASKQPDGVTKLFAAGRTKIYTVSGVGVLTEENSGYTTAATERFRFTQFGDTIIATNNSEKLQSWVLGSSSAFVDLDAAAPVAKYVISLWLPTPTKALHNSNTECAGLVSTMRQIGHLHQPINLISKTLPMAVRSWASVVVNSV